MRVAKIVVLLVVVISICSCRKTETGIASLKSANKSFTFPLDDETLTWLWAMHPYTDKDGKEYLTFQNERKNDLLFYEMNTGKFLHRIKPEKEGDNGVGRFFGYYIEDLDNIYVTQMHRPEIDLIDSTATVKERLWLGETVNDLRLSGLFSVSFHYQPIIKQGDKMYITSVCNRLAEKNPVTVTIDLKTKEVEALPFEYPIFPVSHDKRKTYSIENQFSRIYDGESFIYSFDYDKHIYVASPDHQSVRKILIESKYVPEVEFEELKTSGDPLKNICEVPKYGNMLYDPYRDVYYRLAYPENELELKDNFIELYQYGRKTFSIMIIDKDFNIIGETLFPDYIYVPTAMFIREEGLYISTSHVKNPDFDENVLTFECFELVYN